MLHRAADAHAVLVLRPGPAFGAAWSSVCAVHSKVLSRKEVSSRDKVVNGRGWLECKALVAWQVLV